MGFLLGGTVGIGTVVVDLLLGPAVQAGLRLFGSTVGDAEPAVVAHPGAAPPAA